MVTTPDVAALQAAWEAARDRVDSHDTSANYRAEQAAWDAYSDACDDLDLCVEPGCMTNTYDHAACPKHRD